MEKPSATELGGQSDYVTHSPMAEGMRDKEAKKLRG